MKYVWGVDPGTQGAVAIISEDRSDIRVTRFSQHNRCEMSNILFAWVNLARVKEIQSYFEDVNSFPGEGVTSAHTFGNAAGFLEGLLYAYDVPIEYVTPKNWQQLMALGGSYPSKTARKNAHKDKAKILFPEVKGIVLENADALLIAEYGWRKRFM